MRSAVLAVAAALLLAACDRSPVALPQETAPSFAVNANVNNVCFGQIVAGIAATWPWAHEGHVSFPPPPGAIALWLREFGPAIGVSTVRELQLLFCTP